MIGKRVLLLRRLFVVLGSIQSHPQHHQFTAASAAWGLAVSCSLVSRPLTSSSSDLWGCMSVLSASQWELFSCIRRDYVSVSIYDFAMTSLWFERRLYLVSRHTTIVIVLCLSAPLQQANNSIVSSLTVPLLCFLFVSIFLFCNVDGWTQNVLKGRLIYNGWLKV